MRADMFVYTNVPDEYFRYMQELIELGLMESAGRKSLVHYYIIPAIHWSYHFELWKGYLKSKSNLHFAKFSGYSTIDNEEIWILSTTDLPEFAVEIDKNIVKKIMHLLKGRSNHGL